MFDKILIANRGEIACRVIASARQLGVKTVAVYSDADAGAKHVALADEAVHIGPPAVAESYLQAGRIIAAAQATGAQAIHPGYGFLSENPDFVEAVEAAGLTFIGPPADAIRAMGLKDAAKALMVEAGVPVVPGYHGADQDPAHLATEAEQIGYPVLIKARAGGGGKGMRLVEDPAEFAAALASAQREAEASFGDPVCLIEKFVSQPRHIEIQVFGDSHGNVVHLFERDCSLQRRHQKVIEEAPAPDMPKAVRAAMGAAAVEAARAIGYTGAGTVEFIVDGSGPLRPDGFWFMEMNTRLQVEHPVTEAITGLDLVALQLSVAAGAPLPFGQDDLSINGWAFEARIYAEDVDKGFLPATGRLADLSLPEGAVFTHGAVRVDSGVRTGDEISPFYDPMIAKIITHGPSRAAALGQMRRALEQCHVAGCVTNTGFLGALTRHEGFCRGEVDTGLIGRDLDSLVTSDGPAPEVVALAGLAASGLFEPPQGLDPWDRLGGWRQWSEGRAFVRLGTGEADWQLEITLHGDARYTVAYGEERITLEARPDAAGEILVARNGQRTKARAVVSDGTVHVFAQGQQHSFALPDPLSGSAAEGPGGDAIIAPMPGLVKDVMTTAGATVKKGEALMLLEAMKMEHTLTAPRDGQIAEVLAEPGAQVTDGTLLIALEAEDG